MILPSLSDDSNVQIAVADLTKATNKHSLPFLLCEKVDLFDECANALYHLVIVICRERHVILQSEAPG